MENTSLNKNVFNIKDFNKKLNREFTELITPPPDPTFFDINLATIEDFFELYNKFFYQIAKYGNANSHEQLVKTSGEYISFEKDMEEVKALLEEINSLREENLRLYREGINAYSNNNSTTDTGPNVGENNIGGGEGSSTEPGETDFSGLPDLPPGYTEPDTDEEHLY